MVTIVDRGRRTAQKSSQRAVFRAIDLYAQGLAMRGRMTWPEVRGLRVLMETQLSRPAFRASSTTLLEPVRTRFDDGQVRGEWVERPGVSTRDSHVVLYVHGGAFVAGSPATHRGLTSELARRTERSVFSLDYRLAPAHRFPAAADDVLRAYRWLLASGLDPEQIVVAGDSAGGHLALGLTPRARRAGLPAPGAVLAFSPLVDPSMELGAAWERERAKRGQIIGSRAGRAAIGVYHPGVPTDHPELLLTNDDLSELPPVLIQASESEMLVADARHYVAALQAAGGDAELQTWPRQAHVFQVAFRLSRSADDALTRAAEFVAAH